MTAMQPSGTHANSNNRSVVVLKKSDCTIRGNDVFMPITIVMSQIKKPEREQFKKVEITKEMTERDVEEKLLEKFPYLRNQRFCCAAAVDNRTRLDFNGDRRIWSGSLIKRLLKGNSALYIFVDEQVPGYANMVPQSEASSRSAVATATQNRVDLDVTLVTSLHSLPIGSSVHRESHCLTQPAQSTFCLSSVRDSPKKWQDAASPEQLTTKRPPEQMTTAENESNQTFKKLRATKGVSNNTERNVAGDLIARTLLRALGTATVQGRVSEKASRSYQTEGHLQNLSYGSADMKESAHVPAQLEPLSFDCHPSLASQETKNTTMAIPSHSHPMTTSSNVPVKYPVPQMNSPWTSEHDNHVLLQQFGNGNTQLIQPMETDTHGVNQDLNSSKSSRRWASSAKIAFSSKEPIIDDIEEAFQSPNFYLWESDSLDSEIDFSNLIALPEMDDSELTSLLSPSSFVGSLTPQASINVGLHNQKQRDNTIQMPELPNAMRTQVSHGMRGNYSDSGLGSQSSSSAPQSRNTSDIENSALEEYPIIKIRPNPVGLPGAPSCEFLGLAELFPEVASGYATVGNLDENILWEKGDKHGNGNCIPSSPKAGKQIVRIYSATGKKLAEAKLSYVDDCQHTEDECLKTVGERASQSYEELCRVMSDILIRCRPQASIKSGKTQHSGNSESSLIVQVLRFLINEAEESGLRWDSLPLLEFVAMNHDHENAALFLEEITDRYARDITPEGRERIDLSELLAAINASREEDEATDSSDGRNDSDSSYDGDVESLLCDSEEPTSDSEHDHSDMLRKVVATGNEIQMGENNAETDERVILNLQSGYFSGAQIGEKETQPTHSRLKDSTVSLKESVTTERVSDQPFPMSSDSMLPFGKNGKFSRKPIAIKQREKDSKRLQGENRISRIRFHFNNEFPHLTSRKSVRQPIICFLLTTESINRCLSTIEDRWRIQLHLQRLSGRMTTSPLSMLFQAMHIKPEEALKSLSTDADLSSPSDNTSRTRCKPFDSPLPRNDSTPSDVVALTSIYRPSGKILLSFVSDRNGFLPPESWFEDEDCELLMECWKRCRCKNNFLALKVMEVKDQPASSGIRAQGRLATGVYKRPLWEEKGLLKRVPENFIGRNWTGKTSLKTSLVWRTNKSRENTEPEPEFLFEEQTSQLICKRSLKKVKSHSSYAEDLSWNPNCSVTVPLKVIEKAKELSKPTDMSLQDCKEVEKAKDDSQEPSTKGMDPSLKLRVPKQPEDVKDYLMSSVYPPVIVNTNHKKTLSCAHADNPYHKAEPKHLVESSYGTLKDNTYSKRLKDPLVVDSKRSESSENVENILSFAERFPPTIKDLKKPQPMRGDVTELKSVIGEKRQDKTKPDNNEESCACSKEADGFKKLQDVERNDFVNENFKRGFPELRKNIPKKKPPEKHQAGSDSGGINQKVPSEILARGSRAKEAFNKALLEGKGYIRRVPVMIVGQERTGKTSLKRSLKGELFNPNEGSTEGIETDPSYFNVSPDVWRTGKNSKDTESEPTFSFEHQVDQLIVESLLKKETNTPNAEDYSRSPSNSGTGGQSVYYDTYPIFLTHRAIYILTCNLSRDSSQKDNAPTKKSMSGKIEDTCCSKTNLDYLDFWMSSVYSLFSSNTNHQETLLPEMLPPVFLVCTRAVKPYRTDVDPRGLASEIYGSLKDKVYGKLLKGLFVVDNSKSGSGDECPGVIKLREKVLSFAKKLPQVNEAIPLKWLKYENVLHLLSKEGYNWVPIEKARQIAAEECGICDDNQFRTLLNFLHDQRVLIHFTESPELENVVILSPQWLIDVFKKVITFKGWEDVEDDFKELWRNLEDHGILAEKLLDHTWKHLFVNQENCLKSLIAIMERFSLLCEWPSEESTKQYLVPSMLRSPPTSDVLELLASASIPSLFVRFESRRVPPGLFSRLIVLFHVWAQKRWKSPIKPLLFNNLALFHIRPHNATSLVLLCHFSCIEIVLCVGDGEALADQAGFSRVVDLNVSRDIHRQMRLFLECMRKECSWLEHMRYEMCVSCPVCSPQKLSSKCRDHCVRGCDCLHLLSELEMQNLPFCKRPVVCGVPRICKEMFVPWFSFSDGQEGRISLTKQQDVNGRNQGEHHAVSRREQSLVLPDGVLKAIRSQSCDAADVVAQMEESVENLQLKPAALVDPTPETKEWIRCLAVTAKNENRMDIVTHLRSITPAGTTGPLLAEHLDVRCIPFKQRKALTFNLCGGDEWKQLAEKLGISYDEIRFLDKRTLNPCNVVLDLVANSRHLNVGEVYYILVECDLAGSADLL